MIFVTGDLHGYYDISKLNSRRFPQNAQLTKEDYVIIAGDFGLLWDNKNDELYWRKWLSQKNFTTLFVDGNHENFDLLESYPVSEWKGGKVRRINESILHLMRGQVFTIQGKKLFTFGGASSHDKEFRKENKSWWARELPSQEEYDEGMANLDRHQWSVDYIITHTCPASTLDLLKVYIDKEIGSDPLNNYFEIIKGKVCCKHWYFGHFHSDVSLTKGQTLLYKQIYELV